MKAIMVMYDSLCRRVLPPYGCDWVKAPNFERLSRKTVTFDNAFAGSMPCMPARRDLHTGRYNFLHRSWGPIEPFDNSMPEILKMNGIYTHLASDHYHYWEEGGSNYHTKYNSWEFSRGQEGDPWKGELRDSDIPELLPNLHRQKNRQNWINRNYLKTQKTMPQANTFENGMDFIKRNHQDDNWFLQIETFDPHEPFDSPQLYKDLYPDSFQDIVFDWPDYRKVEETPAQVKHLKSQYAAMVSMCDDYLGRFIDLMDELELWDDTLIVVCTDHGYMLGEHGWWAKNIMPFYNEIAHVPLFVWDPRCGRKDERSNHLVQFIDFAPTLLDFFQIEPPKEMLGKSLRQTIENNHSIHDYVLFGLFGGQVNITDGRYVYMRGPITPKNTPLFEYTLMPTHIRHTIDVSRLQNIQMADPFNFTMGCRTMKIPSKPQHLSLQHTFGNLLFDLDKDYHQNTPIENPEVEKRMIEELIRLMKINDSPIDQYQRLGLSVESGDNNESNKH